MRKSTATYGALAAAVTLACGIVNAQQREELSEAERAEIQRQTEEIRQRTERLEEQTERLEDQTAELEQQNDEAEDRTQEAAEERTEVAEERADERADERERASEEAADERELNQRREELIQVAEETIEDLRQQNESAAELLDQAYGYAVFDTTKGGLIVTGAGGTGVAMETDGGGEPVFMHLGQAGIGLGAGLENYRLVLLLEDEQTYDQFVSGQWDGNISAQASAGEEGVAAEEQFVDGVRAYRLTDAGLMAQVDVSGVRFWPSEDLNDVQVAEADRSDRGRDAGDDAERAIDETADEAEDSIDEAQDEAEDALE